MELQKHIILGVLLWKSYEIMKDSFGVFHVERNMFIGDSDDMESM